MTKQIFKGSAMLNPVPVILVTSRNNAGKVNVFTVGWTGTACTRPPMVTIAVRPERLSYEFITENGEFVINLPTADMVKKVDYCGVKSGRTNDKITEMNFELEASDKISVPIIKQCPISLECKLVNNLPLGSHNLIIAEIVSVHVEEDLIDQSGKIHLEKANLLCYSHGEYFPVPSKPIGKFGFSVKRKSKK
jgi:flavin reductase (DIM6/NTAB) family NADH-FMN oxidoreductase RutF